MIAELTGDGYTKLLALLADDPTQAAEGFTELRRKLARVLGRRGAAFPEDLADEALTRVARNLAQGVDIQNLNAYSHEVARLVWLESLKAPEQQHDSLEEHAPYLPAPATTGDDEKECRAECLAECLAELPPETRLLIVEYYRDHGRDLIERRRALAVRFGLAREALANRAQRLRRKLETCLTECLLKKAAI